MQGANAQLRERLAEALDELGVAHSQLDILQGLQQQLEYATPGAADLVAAALEQERVLQAARDAQVLQLLRAKVGAVAPRCRGEPSFLAVENFLPHSHDVCIHHGNVG